MESGGGFCVEAFGTNLASVAMKLFRHLISIENKSYVVLSMRFAKVMLQ
jgi:hypothetical protein